MRKHGSHASLLAPGGCQQPFGIPWLVAASLRPRPPSPHGLVSVCLCVSNLLSRMRTLSLDVGLTLNPGRSHLEILTLIAFAQTLCPNMVPFTGSVNRELDIFGGRGGHKSTHSSLGSPGHAAGSCVLTTVGSRLEYQPKFMIPPCVCERFPLSPQPKTGTTGSIRDFFSAPRKEKLSCFEVWVSLGAPPSPAPGRRLQPCCAILTRKQEGGTVPIS